MSLKNVKAGDMVIQHRHHGRQFALVVERATKTQVIVGGRKYRREDGYLVGDSSFYSPGISLASDNDIKMINDDNKKLDLIRKLKNRTFSGIPIEQLIEIDDIASKSDKGE